MGSNDQLRERVRARYAEAATAVTRGSVPACCGPAPGDESMPADESAAAVCCGHGGDSCSCTTPDALIEDEAFGAGLYAADDAEGFPAEALLASLGCGNPVTVADLHAGETVLDLGSGGGIDVLLSARRVGPAGHAYGVDMTGEMLELARTNAARAGATNVSFLEGEIESVPLPDDAVDVVISNCVINLSTDKPAVLAEMFRVLRPGGRIGVSDVVAEDHLSPADRAERGSYVGCIAGALSRQEYLEGLATAGFVEASVELTHEAVPGMHGAIIRAVKPVGGARSADDA